jgi:hypothetical protein
MTKEQAEKILAEHELTIRMLMAAVALESMNFAAVGSEVSKSLSIETGILVPLLDAMRLWTQGGSDYMATLENARKGLLKTSTSDEWSEEITIDD